MVGTDTIIRNALNFGLFRDSGAIHFTFRNHYHDIKHDRHHEQ